MINFAVGPVQSNDDVRELGAHDVPYFRTPEFSRLMLENESDFLHLVGAPEGSRAVFVSGSGTAAMEATIAGAFDGSDRVLVVDGGSFGHRFVELCELHGIAYEAIALKRGDTLEASDLAPYEGSGFSALLVNIHETSTGILYDKDLVGDFCKRNGLLLVVDAISSFLADTFDMSAIGADFVIVGSQKGLACPPGVSIVALSARGLEKVAQVKPTCMYLDLHLLLRDGERGQTPFTPAVGTLIQVHSRLHQIRERGIDTEISKVATLAGDFRRRAKGLPFSMRLKSPSNAVTYVETLSPCALEVLHTLKDEYGIWLCPNGGEESSSSFRVGHLGELSVADNTLLIAALYDLSRREILL
ncbi:alanine--glyoxylate aminotransferase family protein [Olsenella sp. oral taxon 809]|uniref:pyridoxal-phosphate-dependent aminotransferase family protein n=1 Tax=Olsenella sp. oral taxon 809 TaxID=661086 RepID=UPI0018DC9321|nr:aminotransferase class V-fold PLP-dependent enzyme [Olsenella sp. oral taxon 809]